MKLLIFTLWVDTKAIEDHQALQHEGHASAIVASGHSECYSGQSPNTVSHKLVNCKGY